jgi:rhamnose transport system ATP-binding protein
MSITAASAPVALELRGAAKSFGPVVALADGTIELRAGEIHALVGENGAGKSTLVKILAGVHAPDTGEFLVDGKPVSFRTVADSKAAGISVIYQEPTLFPDLTVAENIFIGRQPKGRFGLISRSEMRRQARALFDTLGVPIDPDRIAEGLSIADQQIIEIAKAISLDARVLVMDEPTAALSGVEV